MNGNTAIFILGILFLVVWAGTSSYGHYTRMQSEIARVTGNSEDYRRLIETHGEITLAQNKALKEAVDLAIERLSEREGR